MDTQGIQICLLELPFSQALSKDMSNEAVDTIAADVADLPGTIADKANFILSMRTAFDLDQAAWRLLLRRLPASLQQEVGDQINQGTSGPPGPSGQGPLTLRKMAATLGEEHLKLAACAFSSDHLRTHQGGQDHLSGDAAARTCSGVGQAREVITMDILMPNEHTGREGLLSALLSQLMICWSACQIQVNGRLWGLCHSAQQANNMRQLEDAIMQLVGSLEQHVLFLVDEAQWFLMPRHSDGGLDTTAARNQANFLKRLLYHASDRALWALTGSTMATFWWGLAQMAPHGSPPLTANGLITLSARATDEQIDFCWGQLKKQHGPLPSELKIYAAGSAALLCYHVQEHLLHPVAPIPELVTRIDDKWVVEAGTDWMPSLEGMEKEERKGFYALSVPEEGLDVAAGLQPLYLSQLLCGQLEPIHEGSSKQRLISSLFRMVVQSLIQSDGALMPMPLAKPSSPLVLLEGRQLLLRFANSAMKAQKAGWKGANHQQFICAVESLGASIEMTTQSPLPWSFWLSLVHQVEVLVQLGANNMEKRTQRSKYGPSAGLEALKAMLRLIILWRAGVPAYLLLHMSQCHDRSRQLIRHRALNWLCWQQPGVH
ncbi:hypothetical protein WJX74_000505 [Apatococcus lobatus]|uniref:Uncharacterized protein n=1 Tax=Apatococcus lobatus TaxID=904363 RepID=A0AAW1QHL6_9CHLO